MNSQFVPETNKNALHPPNNLVSRFYLEGRRALYTSSRGTTFIRCCLATPTSTHRITVWLAQEQPSCPGYPVHAHSRGQPAEVYFRIPRFLLAASGSFSRSSAYGLSTSRPFSGCHHERYSSRHSFCLFSCIVLSERKANKNALHPFLERTKSDIYQILMRLSWYHLHALTPHSANLTGY